MCCSDKISSDVERARDENIDVKNLPRTRAVVSGITERLHLLLQVTIMPEIATGITRSTSSIVDAPRIGKCLEFFSLVCQE